MQVTYEKKMKSYKAKNFQDDTINPITNDFFNKPADNITDGVLII